MDVNTTTNSSPIQEFRHSYNTAIRSKAPKPRIHGSTRTNIPSVNLLSDSLQNMKIKRNSRRKSLTKKDGLPKVKIHTKYQTYSIVINPGDSKTEIKAKIEGLLTLKEQISLCKNEGERMVPVSDGDFNNIAKVAHLYIKE
ncbi:hypothetical protein HDV01_002895 [Terramyces sp. JEL0728]|nr:hypothetical protein HDV01_002895 [Terramyces sp. JEL0728]